MMQRGEGGPGGGGGGRRPPGGASRSGLTRAGWVAWGARGSRTPGGRTDIVEPTQVPALIEEDGWTSAGARSTNRSLCSTASTSGVRSAADKARGCGFGTRTGRGGGGVRRCLR